MRRGGRQMPVKKSFWQRWKFRFSGCLLIAPVWFFYQAVSSLPLGEDAAGILHGHNHSQHVHAPFPKVRGDNDKLWLTVQQWNGDTHHAAWPLQ